MRSEWKQGGIDRRDLRATKDDPDPRRPRARKDTRRWCRGRPGREHTLVLEVDEGRARGRTCRRTPPGWPVWWSGCLHHEVCTTCGKELRHSLPEDQCPALGGDGPA